MDQFPTGIAYVSGHVALRRERTRTWLAFIVLGTLVALAAAITWRLLAEGVNDTVVTAIFSPMVAIAGTVLGFYFGSQDSENKR